MTLLDERRGGPPPAAPGNPAPPTGPAAWARDLVMGLRFAAGGGRAGWTRTLLTAVGAALGVALLLTAASVPQLLQGRYTRGEARQTASDRPVEPSPSSLVTASADTEFRGARITGVLLRPDGPHAPAPPGVTALPRPGEMVASPALKELLASPDGALLRERLPYRLTGTIAEAGLIGPSELAYYTGSATLTTEHGGHRTGSFGGGSSESAPSAILVMLIILACVVLLMPVALFIATAVRFGGEGRDRRLAALRLIGADVHMARRMAAGEALFGSLCGLLLGGLLFLIGRQFTGVVTLWDVNAFPSDLTPSPALTVLIALAVPVSAVAVTLAAMRGVTIEPLGVVRHATARRRRLWWRIPVPLIGLAMLLLSDPVDAANARVDPFAVAGGAVLVLLGVTLLLPWAVEAVVARFKGGPVPWQLATRRLQLGSGAAARAVSGITVAVAGAIALQLFVSAVQSDFLKHTGADDRRAQLSVILPAHDMRTIRTMIKQFQGTQGVRGSIAVVESSVTRPGPLRKGEEFAPSAAVTVGDCTALRELARTGPCKDGDAFIVTGGTGSDDDFVLKTARPGAPVLFNADPETGKPVGKPRLWTVPKETRKAHARRDPSGRLALGIFATPGAVDPGRLDEPTARALLKIDPAASDTVEHVRNTAARVDPTMQVITLRTATRDQKFTTVRTGLQVSSTLTMALIAAGLLVSTLEQLRERRRLLSVLVAFGTRRSTLAWSVLWQTAVPVFLGLALALAGGVGLGSVLLRMAGKGTFDWSAIWPLPLAGAGLVLLITLLSLPPLWRMMRPGGLRSE